ncbi:MAG: phosphoribosylanthranilate isomerase [Chloroflexi bacterium]|jgi:phosphoribosylanthranilate isomerase|nr:phosphoribosylanthranilate isomerase [Chloroflexota bacterium]MBT3670133.1 phosphoribosylanthranilate isomerase [Chloroflexota bacterium]MBT4306665.1 phosphoribosylanthranilate isomerase [Chloroflexota bacterium]MBT4533019.1 phosphoribosylanthranilate isomerase [Chloroflexota bacterium]MBT4682817.1 phosphoribosylanthranilate isomerase [Chloroflexota bacterium]
MKIQIYTMQTPEEALEVIASGVDHIGITPGSYGLPGEVDFQTARKIVDTVGDKAVSVALTVDTDLEIIEEMAKAVHPGILHLCALEGALPPNEVAKLRANLPGLPIMQAISVAGPKAIDLALAYQEVAEYIILDTQAADIDGIGASGETHDWTVSREIVRQLNIPVILAGGLSPENVGESIRVVQPWGVDSLTHTNHPLAGGGFKKDIGRIQKFVEEAHIAAIKIYE